MKPESNPPGARTQGFSNVDCVAVWFFCLKEKTTTSPGLAVTELGVKTNPADPPTTTLISTLRTTGASAREKKAAQNEVLNLNFIVRCSSKSTCDENVEWIDERGQRKSEEHPDNHRSLFYVPNRTKTNRETMHHCQGNEISRDSTKGSIVSKKGNTTSVTRHLKHESRQRRPISQPTV